MCSQYEMQFPFTTRREILDGENGYIDAQSEGVMELERTVMGFKENVQSRVSRETPNGYLLKTELSGLAPWLKNRFLPSNINKNPDGFIERITAEAFSLDDDSEKLIRLKKICGVRWSIASVILHLYDRKKFPILSYHALRSVEIPEECARGPEYPFWQDYFNLCRAKAERYDVSMRTLDRALWQYSESGEAESHS